MIGESAQDIRNMYSGLDNKTLIRLWKKAQVLPRYMNMKQLEVIKNYCKKDIDWKDN